MNKKSINIKKIIEKFNITLANKSKNIVYRDVLHQNIKRLGLVITEEVEDKQINENIIYWGQKESEFFTKKGREKTLEIVDKILKNEPPMLVLSKNFDPNISKFIIDIADKHKVPLYIAQPNGVSITAGIGIFLNEFFSKQIQIHGCLVSINGLGVLIVGKPGIGKSEATLSLIQKGHIFISDDSVVVKQISENFYGESPEITQNLIEIRGIGLIDVKYTYGIKSITKGSMIKLVVELVGEEDSHHINFDRLGIEYLKYNVLEGSIPKVQVPIKGGSSAASLIEAAVSAYLAKKDGMDIAKELTNRSKKSRKEI
ncbi:HPr(Ser) kinase/phosphatase [Mycoplasma sp. Mirounga ES2805-ORL]|uniref:HPr(Ser) kinase/phosphatase n=1 Tax=Mycoplasma sp. Mirounga ES2805-ORL TaxID=754514 RepID=UPI00197C6571|nr:HPr(Ser) kinase/phosphatase [Mycoplasma sp. Mirounga ES2805-ORL]QSF13450.1 HPr kinase/phosphorylase [Mycoplasma sp. Mirounga ES2805-ORL]